MAPSRATCAWSALHRSSPPGLFIATGAALGLGWTVALASAVGQGGLVFAPTSLLPTLSRMSPAAKLKQLFSITALRGLIKSLLPAGAVAYIAIGCLRRDWLRSWLLSAQSARGTLGFAAGPPFRNGLEVRSRTPGLGGARLPVRAAAPFERTENEPPGNQR
jgi:hypothetical protein